MNYGRYRFICVLDEDSVLPEYKGSTFRGVFGRALKRVVCALKQQECSGCLLRQTCIYAMLFETRSSLGVGQNDQPSPPYVIEPDFSDKTVFNRGDSFEFGLILFGRANDYLAQCIYAFKEMGKMGIGRKANGSRSRFHLEKVVCGETVVYSAGDDRFVRPETADLVLTSFDERLDVGEIELSLLTPLRTKFENHLSAELPFHVFIRAALRRVSSLNRFYGEGDPPLDYKGLIERAEKVETYDPDLCWFDWKRFSSRQDRKMFMGGIMGNVHYVGELSEFMPVIRYCEKAHLGKQTSFGLGKISTRIVF